MLSHMPNFLPQQRVYLLIYFWFWTDLQENLIKRRKSTHCKNNNNIISIKCYKKGLFCKKKERNEINSYMYIN